MDSTRRALTLLAWISRCFCVGFVLFLCYFVFRCCFTCRFDRFIYNTGRQLGKNDQYVLLEVLACAPNMPVVVLSLSISIAIDKQIAIPNTQVLQLTGTTLYTMHHHWLMCCAVSCCTCVVLCCAEIDPVSPSVLLGVIAGVLLCLSTAIPMCDVM